MKNHIFNGLAGCVTQSVSQETGFLVGLYSASQADLCEAGGNWVTVCEEHGTTINHETQKIALSHLPYPTGWCEECRSEN